MHLAIIDGPAWRRWNPDTAILKGAGGAQMALVDLPPRLARRGWRVTVYADCAGAEGTYSGVQWLDYRRFAGGSADVLMVWRQPAALSVPFRAGRTVFMARDAHYGEAISQATTARVDLFAVLSGWHGDYWQRRYPFCAGRIWQTRNGVDLGRYRDRAGIVRERRRVVYTSAPYRGLDVALETWPLVRETVPDAELHVYYGFYSSEKLAARGGDPGLSRRLERVRGLLDNTPGAIFHGGCGRREIDQALMGAQTWFYPSTFYETSCAAAMEAQCAGCHVITNGLGALQETASGCELVTDRSPAGYARAIVARMQAADPAAGPRAPDTARFCIDRLADEWHATLSQPWPGMKQTADSTID